MKKIQRLILLNLTFLLFSMILIFTVIATDSALSNDTSKVTENNSSGDEPSSPSGVKDGKTKEGSPLEQPPSENPSEKQEEAKATEQLEKGIERKLLEVTGVILVLIILFAVAYFMGRKAEKESHGHYKYGVNEVIKKQNSRIKELEKELEKLPKDKDFNNITKKYQDKIKILEEKNNELEEKNKEALQNKTEIQEKINKEWERNWESREDDLKNDFKKDVLKYFMRALDTIEKTYSDYKNKGKEETNDVEAIYNFIFNSIEHIGIEIIPKKTKDGLSGYKVNGKIIRDPK